MPAAIVHKLESTAPKAAPAMIRQSTLALNYRSLTDREERDACLVYRAVENASRDLFWILQANLNGEEISKPRCWFSSISLLLKQRRNSSKLSPMGTVGLARVPKVTFLSFSQILTAGERQALGRPASVCVQSVNSRSTKTFGHVQKPPKLRHC